jgi:hypothetical protein
MKNLICVVVMIGSLIGSTCAGVVVHLDTQEVKDSAQLTAWGNQAKELIEQWYPRIVNMIPTKGFTPPAETGLTMRNSDKGIAWTSGDHITVASGWVKQHPEDIGLVFHELVHVIQHYKQIEPSWVMEGIADYLRWAIYEGKSPNWFPYNDKPRGFEASYQVTAGFFLWLETDACPGIVNRLSTAMRKNTYQESFFKEQTGRSLESLWAEYSAERKQAK